MKADSAERFTLNDGRRLLVREILPADRAHVEEGFRQLSDRSRFLRYFGVKKRLSGAELDTLTDPTDLLDIALGAAVEDPDCDEPVPAGVARFVRVDPEEAHAEIALTIVDAFQGLGIGTCLLIQLAKAARSCGVAEFSALVRRENTAMRALSRHFGGRETWLSGTELSLNLSVNCILNSPVPE